MTKQGGPEVRVQYVQSSQEGKEFGTGEEVKECQQDRHIMRERVEPDKTGELGRK